MPSTGYYPDDEATASQNKERQVVQLLRSQETFHNILVTGFSFLLANFHVHLHKSTTECSIKATPSDNNNNTQEDKYYCSSFSKIGIYISW